MSIISLFSSGIYCLEFNWIFISIGLRSRYVLSLFFLVCSAFIKAYAWLPNWPSRISLPESRGHSIRIVTERFVESFARRFAEVAPSKGEYQIKFYEINECPAKVSVKIISQQDYSFVKRLFTRDTSINTEETDIVNEITAILETRD